MWTLDYHGTLKLEIPVEESVSFAASSFYKLFLRRYATGVDAGLVSFKASLTYLDYQKVIALCQKEADKRGLPLVIKSALTEYIQSRELHLEVRSRLGIELKNHAERLEDRFEAYRAVVDANMARRLRPQQMWDSFYMCAMQKSANFSVPGSGKTASVLGMYAYLRANQLVKRILVVCPKNAFGSWMDEFSICFDGIEPLRAMNIHDPQYKSAQQRRTAIQLDAGRCNLVLVNYESVGNLIEELLELLDANTLLVFDEVHKIKRVGGEYAEQSLRLAKAASYTVAMTGTPIPNSYRDIYNLLHVLFYDEYEEFFGFSLPMLKQPRIDEMELINDKLQPFFCRTTKEQLCVPAANQDIIDTINASDRENRLLNILQMRYRHNKLALLIRILQMESNPKLLMQQLNFKDFAYLLDDSVEVDEIDFADYSEEIRHLIETSPESSKFSSCVHHIMMLVEQKKPVIVWCMFVDSIRNLANALHQKGIIAWCVYGEVPLEERQAMLDDFRTGRIQVLLTNPHTLAESVSLHSVCHDAIYFEYSYNLVHLLQSKDRIHRLGLPDGQYTQYYFQQVTYQTDEGEWSLGKAVYHRLKEKEQIMLDAIANRKLEIMPTSNEDLELIFTLI